MTSSMTRPQLIALDMDGTLLDEHGQLPAGFADVSTRARELGVALAPASGRQLATLRFMFPDHDTFIAENGTVVMHDGRVVSTTAIAPDVVDAALEAAEGIGKPHMVVLCTPEVAYVRHGATAEGQEVLRKYYHSTQYVDELPRDVEVIKIAIFCAAGTEEHVLPAMQGLSDRAAVVVSGHAWLDVMAAEANKGVALTQLAAALGIDMAQTCAFGDFLNDFEMLKAAGVAIAMENAHPRLKEIADRIAPPNTEAGAITVMRELLA